MVVPMPKFMTTWRQQTKNLQKDAFVFYFVFKHPRTPWYVKVEAACSVAYLFSPVQIIPSFIPVIGFLDDFLVLLIGAKVIRRFTPSDVLTECRESAEAAEIRKKEEVRSGIVSSTRFVTTVWLVVAVVGGVLVAAFLHR